MVYIYEPLQNPTVINTNSDATNVDTSNQKYSENNRDISLVSEAKVNSEIRPRTLSTRGYQHLLVAEQNGCGSFEAVHISNAWNTNATGFSVNNDQGNYFENNRARSPELIYDTCP